MKKKKLIKKIAATSRTRVFYINVGNMCPEDAEKYLSKIAKCVKRKHHEDLIIPIREGMTRVEVLPN